MTKQAYAHIIATMNSETGSIGHDPSEMELDEERQVRIDKGIKNLARFALDREVWIYRKDRSTNELFDPLSAEELISDDKLPESRRIVEDMLSRMSERERFVVMANFGLSDGQARTLKDIGNGLQLSRSRVYDIKKNALSWGRLGRDSITDLNDLALKGRRVMEIYRSK